MDGCCYYSPWKTKRVKNKRALNIICGVFQINDFLCYFTPTGNFK